MAGKKKTLCVAAGSSGGHLIPALVVAREWKKANAGGRVILWTSGKDLDKRVVQDFPFIDNVFTVSLRPFSWNPFKMISCFVSMVAAYFKVRFAIAKYDVEKMITTGGIVAIPVSYAARRRSIPVVVYELNAVPGKATRALAKGSDEIKLAFDRALGYFEKRKMESKCEVVSYPIKFDSEATKLPVKRARELVNERVKEFYGLKGTPLLFQPTRSTLLVIGGSQGSESFNDFMRRLLRLRKNNADKIQVIHQVGSDNCKRWQRQYQKAGIPALVFSYTSYMEECYVLADYVVSRAGAGSLFELSLFGKNAMLVPLEGVADNHQVANAEAMASLYPGLFTVVGQDVIEGDIRRGASILFKRFKLDARDAAVKPARRSSKVRTGKQQQENA